MEEGTEQIVKEPKRTKPTLQLSPSPSPLRLSAAGALGPRPLGEGTPRSSCTSTPFSPLAQSLHPNALPREAGCRQEGPPQHRRLQDQGGPGACEVALAWGGLRPRVCSSPCLSLPRPKPSTPASGTLCPAGSSPSTGLRGLGPASSINPQLPKSRS